MPQDRPNPSPAAVEPGALIGPYRVAGVVADRRSGTVYEAVETATGHRVALRRLPDRLANDPAAVERFLTAAGARLRHPNVVAAQGVERHGGEAFLVMEFVGGRTAAADNRVPWRVATRIVRDAARGLAAVHNAGLVHGQVRPGHLIVAHDGTVKLADLGVAAADDAPVNPACAAPEQIRGEPPSGRSDQYALGAVYFTLLTGRPPFGEAGNPIDVYDAVLHRPVPTVRMCAPDIPLRCDTIVGRAMAKDPAARYPSADALVADLDAVLAADPAPHRPVALPKLPRRPSAWGRIPAALTGLVVVAGLAAAAWYILGPTDSSAPSTSKSKVPPPGLPTETNSVGMVLARVPAGKYFMGDRLIPDNQRRLVQISKPFLVGVHEVTQEQFRQVMGSNPSQFVWDNRPVDSVTWAEAVDFCARLSARSPEKAAGRVYRLPTEAEWEFACRAGTETPFSLGPTLRLEMANARPGGLKSTTPVGTFPPNPWGLYDVHGNVWEWCSDWYDPAYAEAIDPAGPPDGTKRVTRGGSWQDDPADCRSAYRCDKFAPNERSPAVGFRVACTVGGTP